MNFLRAAVFVAFSCLSAASVTCAGGTGDSATEGVAPVGMVTRSFTDAKRQNWQGTGPRPLQTVVWYPAKPGSRMEIPALGDPAWRPLFVQRSYAVDGEVSSPSAKYPLILLSHGSTSVGLSLSWLGAYLASHGYIAAAVDHHGNTGAEGQPLSQGFVLQWERAGDLSALLDRLLADPLLGNHIDQSRIGAAGHSAGGATVIMIAGGRFNAKELGAFCNSPRADNTCEPRTLVGQALRDLEDLKKHDPVVQASMRREADLSRDARIRAVFAMAPAVGPAFSAATLSKVSIPVRIVTGAVDDVTPLTSNAQWYAEHIPGAKLSVLGGNVGHMTFGSDCTPQGRLALDVCRDDAGVDRAQTHEQVSQSALAFFEAAWAQEK